MAVAEVVAVLTFPLGNVALSLLLAALLIVLAVEVALLSLVAAVLIFVDLKAVPSLVLLLLISVFAVEDAAVLPSRTVALVCLV